MRSAKVVTGIFLLCLSAPACAQSADGPAPGQWTIGVDALSWWLKDGPVPFPIVTDGILGQAGTQVLLGDAALSTGSHPGWRLHAGYSISNRFGIEGNVLSFASRSAGAGVESSGEPGSTDLYVPYIDAATGAEAATELSMSPIYRGSAHEELRNKLQGAELNARWTLAPGASWQMDVLGGLRYLKFGETWTLTTQSPYLPAFGPDIWDTTDIFDSRNSFYGVQGGVRVRFDEGRFFGDGAVKVGIGAMRQSTQVQGFLVTNDFTFFGPTETYFGGYFALPSNMGHHSRTEFAVVPEATFNLGYRITPAAAITCGYSFLYANRVLRPGDQVSRTIDTTQSTSYTEDPESAPSGPAQPGFRFRNSSFWAQGVHIGFTFRF